jgi:hypothetical protein
MKELCSKLIVLKCVLSSKELFYIEIDTGRRELSFHSTEETYCRYGVSHLAEKINRYELDLALRFSETGAEALEALKKLGFPQKLETTIICENVIAKRVVLDFVEPMKVTKITLPEKTKRVSKTIPAAAATAASTIADP